MNHDLNMTLDFSYRDQANLTRSIQTGTSEATSGNRAIKVSFTASYTLSRLLTSQRLLRASEQQTATYVQFLPHHHSGLRS
jgi:cell surface protein SprA